MGFVTMFPEPSDVTICGQRSHVQWGSNDGVHMARIISTSFWVLLRVEDGVYTLSYHFHGDQVCGDPKRVSPHKDVAKREDIVHLTSDNLILLYPDELHPGGVIYKWYAEAAEYLVDFFYLRGL